MENGEILTTTVTSVLKDVGTVVSQAVGVIADNPILAVFLGLGLLTAGAFVFKRLRKSAT